MNKDEKRNKAKQIILSIIWGITIAALIYVFFHYVVFEILKGVNLSVWGPFQIAVFIVLIGGIVIFIVQYWEEIIAPFSGNWVDSLAIGLLLECIVFLWILPRNIIKIISFPRVLFFCGFVLLILYLFYRLYMVFRISKKNIKNESKNDEDDTESYVYVSDDPINSLEGDLLGRGKFVLSIAQSICGNSIKNGFVIGLNGKWGEGKSSVMNMVEQVLTYPDLTSLNLKEKGLKEKIIAFEKKKSREKISIIKFSPWYFNSQDELIEQFFYSIQEELIKIIPHEFKNRVRELFSLYVKSQLSFSIEPEIKIFGLSFRTKIFSKKKHSPIDKKGEIIAFLKENNTRQKILIIIDDIDRLEKKDILLVLKLVKLCSNFPNFVFLLSYDKEELSRLIEDENSQYLEKIVQQQISLPMPEHKDLENFVIEYMKKCFKNISLFDDEHLKEFLYPDVSSTFLARSSYSNSQIFPWVTEVKTFRGVKEYINLIVFLLPQVIGDVYYTDFLLIGYLMLFYPRLYSFLPNLKESLLTNNNEEMWTKDGEPSSNIKILLNELYSNINTLEHVQGILKYLFPKAFNINRENKLGLGIQEENCFDRYFQLKLSANDISTDEWKEIVKNWDNSDFDSKIIYNSLLSRKNRLSEYISVFKKQYIQILEEKKLQKLIIGVLNTTNNDYLLIQDEVIDLSIFLIVNNLSDHVLNEVEFYNFLNSLFEQIPLPLLANLVKNSFILGSKIEKLSKKILERIEQDVIIKEINIICEYFEHHNWFQIWGIWKLSLEKAHLQPEYSNYFNNILPRYPYSIIKLFESYTYLSNGAPFDSKMIEKALYQFGIEKITLWNCVTKINKNEINGEFEELCYKILKEYVEQL